MGEMTGRLLAIGDIHGYREQLERLLAMVAPTPDDRVVFVGDYIDRGPDSCGVIEYLLDFGNRFPGTEAIFLRGNHEQLLLDFLAEYYSAPTSPPPPKELAGHQRLKLVSHRAGTELGESDRDNYMLNGGQGTIACYEAKQQARGEANGIYRVFPPEHIGFIAATRLWHEEQVTWQTPDGPRSETFFFVHAGIRPGVPLAQQHQMDLLWIRDAFLRSNKRFDGRIVVHGHTPNVRVPTKHPRRICVDSGVYRCGPAGPFSKLRWGKLTCCNVLTREIWQA